VIVGLTGGIATGKSTVTNMLRELGAYVVDADVWARKIVEPGSPALQEIAEAFGPSVIRADGTLDRAALAAVVFRDDAARQRLNEITHPRVREGMKQETMQYLREHPGQPVVWDVPLLFEGETKRLVDTTVLVYVDEATQLRRLMERDGLSEEDALARIRAQMPIEEKRKVADHIIDNRGTREQTREQVARLWHILRTQAERPSGESSSSTDGR
jgi:dephospho-CoA kinase